MSSAPSMSYWSIFERSPAGLADFAGSNSNGWLAGPVSIKKKTKLSELYETGGVFRATHPVSTSIGISCLQNRAIPLDSSRKLTNCSLRQQGAFFTSGGEKACQIVEKSCFGFRSHNNSRPHETEKTQNNREGTKANRMPTYRVREHNKHANQENKSYEKYKTSRTKGILR